MPWLDSNPHRFMEAHRFDRPWMRLLGHGVWLALFTLALVFWRQRAFFMDAGFQLFNLINEETIQVYHYRFVTVVPQVLPWLLLQAGAPLRLLGMVYSASFIAFYALAWWLLAVRLGNERMGWVLISLFTFISLDTFYHIQSEFYLGLTLLLVLFGLVLHRPARQGWPWWGLALPLVVTIGFSHKLAVIFFAFLWVFFFIREPLLRNRQYLTLLIAMLITAAVKSVWFTNWYEAAKQAEFHYNWQQYFPHFERLPSNAVMLERMLHHYYMLPGLLLIVSVFYLRRRAWVKLGLVWSFTLGYLLLYNIADPQSRFRFYSEVSYLPSILFAAVPFFFEVVPVWEKSRRWGLHSKFGRSVLFGLVGWRLIAMAAGHQPFTRQFDWIQRQLVLCDRLGTNRLLMPSSQAPADTVIMEWGVPFTAMHLSATPHPDSARTLLILPDFKRYERELKADTFFLSPFKPFPVSWLNERYYDLGRGFYKTVPANGR